MDYYCLFFYDTWLIAIGVGGLSLLAYYSAKLILRESNLYQYVLSFVFGIFMAQYIYQMHGMFEMHFLAFIGSAILITYQNWRLQIPIVLVVVIHHALFGYLQFVGLDHVYFTRLEYMDLETFMIHILFASIIFFICGLWAYQLHKYHERYIRQTFEMGRLQEVALQKEALLAISENLKLSNERLNEAEQIAQLGNWEKNFENNQLIWSDQMFRIFGVEPQAFSPSYEKYLSFVHCEEREYADSFYKKSVSDNLPFEYECRIITTEGIIKNISAKAKVVVNDQNQVTKLYGIVQDITRRKRDEELLQKSEFRLEQKNSELEIKNRELEQFAYVSSHDLQEPLRTTFCFAELLQKQYHGKLDDKADKYLTYLMQSVDRMRILIKDLLEHSRLGNNRELQTIDCNTILNDVIADIDSAVREAKADVKYDSLPVINGYPTELKQLFQNLIMNGIKFRKKDIRPEIKISAKKIKDYWEFEIKDNGIGIEEEYNEKIFVIFQRLHTRSQYEGSGIGLSHCKKIAELHKGKIWVKSAPGEGSSFHFTIHHNN